MEYNAVTFDEENKFLGLVRRTAIGGAARSGAEALDGGVTPVAGPCAVRMRGGRSGVASQERQQ